MKFIQIGNIVINPDHITHVDLQSDHGNGTIGVTINVTSVGPQGTGKYIMLNGSDADKARAYFSSNSSSL